MDGPGTVTWEEFLENAERFLVVSDKISDGWEFHGDKVHHVPSSHLFTRIKRKPNGRNKICKSNHINGHNKICKSNHINNVNVIDIHDYAIYSRAVNYKHVKYKTL